MIINPNFRTKSHCKFLLTYHIVIVTKFRYHVLTPEKLTSLVNITKKWLESINTECLEINGESDHLHILLSASPQDTLGKIIGALKSFTSSEMHRLFKFPKYWGKHSKTLWSSGYFVCSTGGAPLEVIKKYIENQANPKYH